MIVLFTDFGPAGPYTGQMTAALRNIAPDVPVIDLLSNAPAFEPQASAYLLAALIRDFPDGSVFLGIVDPGVGGDRMPVIVKAAAQWFVGPDNGLFDIVIRRSGINDARAWRLTHQPEHLSASFHGRDLFAPAAAKIALGHAVPGEQIAIDELRHTGWPDDLAKIIYIDHFGNAITGIRARTLPSGTALRFSDTTIMNARVFSDVETGALFWYENANGLAEIAVNQGRAVDLGFVVGAPVTVLKPDEAINQVWHKTNN
ncbi:MAG: SAM-dependent chlorinase/fluorinase [Rhodospirillales bacterium]|nr:SAM-dependent chlorinase/fluorinase [Rhodospirillales bacterium]